MINFKFDSVFVITALLATVGCKKNEPQIDLGQLNGRWELNWAQVNGSETDRLRDLYFVFLADTSMQTNILGSERNYKYQFDGQIISQSSDPALQYLLKEVNDSTLTVETEIRGSTFTIHLDKAQPTVNTEM